MIWFNAVIPKITSANLYKPIHDINYSTSICPFQFGTWGKEGKNYKIWIYQEWKEYFQGTFCIGHTITAVIWPVGNKDLSTLVISQVSFQIKQVKKLHMPIKQVHKSLTSINKKLQFCLLSSHIYWLMQVYILTMTLIMIVNWWSRQALKSKTGTLCTSLEIMRWSVKTLPPRNFWL